MIKVDIRGLDGIRKMLADGNKQARYAASVALNGQAFQAMRDGRAAIQSGLDRPTRWTVTSWYVRRRATKAKLEAVVGWSDYLANKQGNAADYYLAQQWTGGGRKHKAFENRLIRAGLMPAGMYAVPGRAAEELKMIDGNGNMKGSVLVAILSAVQAFRESGYTANASTRQSKRMSASKMAGRHVYWAGKPGPNTPNGIWVLDERHRKGRGRLRPVIIFVRAPVYRAKLNMQRIASGAVSGFPAAFERAYAAALATARRA